MSEPKIKRDSKFQKVLRKWTQILEAPFVFIAKTSVRPLFGLLFALFAVVSLAVFCIGISSVTSVLELDEIWLKTDSRMIGERDFYREHFGGIERQEALGVTNNPPDDNVFTEAGFNVLLTQSAATYALKLEHTVQATGEKVNITLDDICERPTVPKGIAPLAPGSFLYASLTQCLGAINGSTISPLPLSWGIDKFPCTRATPLDVFQEGAYDYPPALQQLQLIALKVATDPNLPTCLGVVQAGVQAQLSGLGLAGDALAKEVATSMETLQTLIAVFSSWGYAWKPSFRSKSPEELFNILNQAAVNNKDKSKSLPACIQESLGAKSVTGLGAGIGCFRLWNGDNIEEQLFLGGISGYQDDGGFTKVENMRVVINIENQDAFIMRKYFESLGVTTKEEREQILLDYEQLFIEFYNPIWEESKSSGVKFDFFADRQRDDIVRENQSVDIGLVVATICIIAVLVTLCLIKVSSSRVTDCFVWSRSFLGLGGLGLIGLSILASFGISGWIGFEFTPLNYGVVPFLALGLGVDDMLVLAYSVMLLDNVDLKNVETQVVNGVRASGPSIFLTSLVNFVAFMVASSIEIPAVQSFCWNMSIVVVLNFFVLIFAFIPLIVLDTRRVQSMRYDWLFCKKNKNVSNPFDYTKRISTLWGRFLSFIVVKIIVICVFAGLFGWLAWAGFTKVERGIVLSDIAQTETSVYDMALLGDNSFLGASDYLVSRTMDYTTVGSQKGLLDAINACDDTSPWASNSMLVEDYSFFASGAASLLTTGNTALYNNSNTDNLLPLPDLAYYAVFNEWIGDRGLGRINLAALSCKSQITNEFIFCDDIDQKPILVATKSSVYTKWMDSTENVTQSIEDHRSGVDAAANQNGIPGSLFVYGDDYLFSEQYLESYDDLYFTVGMALIAIFGIITILQGSIVLSFLVCGVILTTVIEIYGLMYYIDVKLNGFSLVNLVVSVGFCVEFTAHLARAFQMAKGSRNERMIVSLQEMLWPMTVAALTTIFGVLVLLAHPYDFYTTYYVQMFSIMTVIAFANGSILLPVLLSLMGPSELHSIDAQNEDAENLQKPVDIDLAHRQLEENEDGDIVVTSIAEFQVDGKSKSSSTPTTAATGGDVTSDAINELDENVLEITG